MNIVYTLDTKYPSSLSKDSQYLEKSLECTCNVFVDMIRHNLCCTSSSQEFILTPCGLDRVSYMIQKLRTYPSVCLFKEIALLPISQS